VSGHLGLDSTAVVETVTDLGFDSGTTLTFTLEHYYHYYYPAAQVNLGRFRLSVTTDDRSTFADGFVQGGDVTAKWIVLDPLTFSSSQGATITKLSDQSLLVSGTNPTSDVYTVSAQTHLTGITGFRIEALADPSLPSGGPGRHPNGNFHLTSFIVNTVPLAQEAQEAQLVATCKPAASHSELANYDPSAQIRFTTPAEADAKRQELIDFVWPGGLPTTAMPTVSRGISFPEDLGDVTPSLVSNVDHLHFNIHVAEHQLPSSSYLLSPTTPATVPRLGIVHQGHQGGTGDGVNSTIDYLLGQGFHVVVMQMPFFGGNSTMVTMPDGSMMTFASSTNGHSNLFSQLSGRLDGGLFAFFLKPVVQSINHFVDQNPNVQDITMIGLSGGGWTTHMAAALDTRIDLSIAVAGALPLYARPFNPGSVGDAEQEYGPRFH